MASRVVVQVAFATVATAFQVGTLHMVPAPCETFETMKECHDDPSYKCAWFRHGDNTAIELGSAGKCQRHCKDKNGATKSDCEHYGLESGRHASVPSYCHYTPSRSGDQSGSICTNIININCPEDTERTYGTRKGTGNPICRTTLTEVEIGAKCLEAQGEISGSQDIAGAKDRCEADAVKAVCAWKPPIDLRHQLGGTDKQLAYCVARSVTCEENKSKEHCDAESEYCVFKSAAVQTEQGCFDEFGETVCIYDMTLTTGKHGACLPKTDD